LRQPNSANQIVSAIARTIRKSCKSKLRF